MKQLMNQNEE